MAAATLLILLATPACISGVTIPYMQETNEEHLIGTTTAILNFSSFITVAIFGKLTGWLLGRFPADANGVFPPRTYLTLCAILLGLEVVSIVVTSLIAETYGRHTEVR